MKVGRLKVIFTLPETLRNWYSAPQVWSTGHLGYVEWFRTSAEAGRDHNMYTVQRVELNRTGAVVPLHTIRQVCQLIPLTGLGISWKRTWNSANVLDECIFFLLNNCSSNYAYQTIW